VRILHITNAYPTSKNSSYGIFIKEQIDALKLNGLECNTIFIDALTHGKLQYFKQIRSIRQAAERADIVHCHHSYSAFVTRYLAGVKKPMVVSFLSSVKGETDSLFKKIVFKSVLRSCSAFIDKSNPDIEKSSNKKGFYLPNGVNLEFFKEIRREDAKSRLKLENGKYLLFCASGSVHRREKRYDLFSDVVKILKNDYKLPVSELLLSNVERELTPYYYNAASAHVLTSDFEGSPNSVKEAIACNVPVVSTNVGNVKLLLDGIPGCHISSTHSASEIAKLCVEALEYDRIPGRQNVIANQLDMGSTIKKLVTIYQAVLRNSQ
jgi:teichuronic acid biosynthesis glycosyltransferase TuaC